MLVQFASHHCPHREQQDEPLGWDVAAMTDVTNEYVDSCGLCYEVACSHEWTSDG